MSARPGMDGWMDEGSYAGGDDKLFGGQGLALRHQPFEIYYSTRTLWTWPNFDYLVNVYLG